MTLARRYAAAGLAIFHRDLVIFVSYRWRMLTSLASTLLSLTIFYYVAQLVRAGFDTPADYFAFVAVGLVIFGVLTSTLSSAPTSVRQELVAGTFERIVASPFGAVAAVASMMLFPLTYALVNGALTLVIAEVVFGLPLQWDTAPLALLAALLGALAFLPFGLLIGAGVVVVKQAMVAGGVVLSLMSISAGLYFPVVLLPDWIEWASEVQPFTPAVDLMRHLLVGTPLESSAWLLCGRIAGFTAVLLPASLWVLTQAVRVSQRRGTITEY